MIRMLILLLLIAGPLAGCRGAGGKVCLAHTESGVEG